MDFPAEDASVFVRRRTRLGDLVPDPVIVFGGRPRPRNYAANTLPFRADSHFLYLVGANLPDAVLVGREGSWELFMSPTPPDDAMWHGVRPGFDAIARSTGVSRVRPSDELRAALAGLDLATVPAIDPSTRSFQASLLGRTWGAEDEGSGSAPLGSRDASLADALVALRSVHDDAALTHLRRAAEGSLAGHLAGMHSTGSGLRESTVRAAIEAEFVARGMDCAYGSIVTVHGEILHNHAHHHILEDGDLLLVDAGAEDAGWASDVTRTWPVSGRFSPTQREFYEIVLRAQLASIDMVRPGVRYRDIHRRACVVLTEGLVDTGILRGDPESLVDRGAHALLFPHGIGHLIGLDVHDMEDLGDRAGYGPGWQRSQQFGLKYLRLDRVLAPGTMVTIEPGLYQAPAILDNAELAGPFDRDRTLDRTRLAMFRDVRGIRIEDDVLCTEGAPDVLTAAIPKGADEVAAMVGDAGAAGYGRTR